jgi:hypothetical protein
MVEDPDGYENYYAQKLWSLLPQIYRTHDATNAFDPTVENQPNGPLRELVNRIGAKAATLRRSIDRMWEDQSIETCDDWVIPYIGAQVAVNLVSSLDAQSQRLAVAKAIYFRQRKGVFPLLEEIAEDVTAWDARVIELYRRMGRARHGLDPALGWPVDTETMDANGAAAPSLAVASGLIGANTRTCAGGYADLRNDYGASRAGSAFDELSYTADVRLGRGIREWYNIPNIGIFLWRLQSVPVTGVTPVAASSGSQYTFDPTGRDVALFAAPTQAYDTDWVPRQEYQLPGPIDARLLKRALSKLYASADATSGFLAPNSFGLYSGTPSVTTLTPLGQISADPHDTSRYFIDPVRGRITAPGGLPSSLQPFLVGYCYGFSASIGAGGYDRRLQGQASSLVEPLMPTVTGGRGNLISASGGTLEIGDSLTYDNAPNYTINSTVGPNSLVIRSSNQQRPLIRFAPSSAGSTQWTFMGSSSNGLASALRLDGLFVSGGDIVLAGSFDSVALSNCTLDPGAWDGTAAQLAIDGQPLVPCRLKINGTVRRLVIDRCILGPIITNDMGSVEHVTITNSIIQVVDPSETISLTAGATAIRRCTILGKTRFQQLEASDSLFCDVATVADNQKGCVRFSAWTRGSVLPCQYQSVELEPWRKLFASTAFGQPNYAQLLPSVDPKVGAGAQDGSEMGAFAHNKNPIKERSLLIQYQEFLPIGLNPVLIYVT